MIHFCNKTPCPVREGECLDALGNGAVSFYSANVDKTVLEGLSDWRARRIKFCIRLVGVVALIVIGVSVYLITRI